MAPMLDTLAIVLLAISSISSVLIASFVTLAGMQVRSFKKHLDDLDRQRKKEDLDIEIYKEEKAALAIKALNLMVIRSIGWESGNVI